jgi:hypothetical protein
MISHLPIEPPRAGFAIDAGRCFFLSRPDLSRTVPPARLTPGGSFDSRLDVLGDRDWIAITLTAGQWTQMDMTGSGAYKIDNPYLCLMDAQGTTLFSDDDRGPDLDARRQLPPAQIKAFATSRGSRAKTYRIDAELIAWFMAFRPDARRTLPAQKLRVLRALTGKRSQLVETRKRLLARIKALQKQGLGEPFEGHCQVFGRVWQGVAGL